MNLPPGIRRMLRPAALVGVGLLVGGGLVVLGNHDGGGKKRQPGEIAQNSASGNPYSPAELPTSTTSTATAAVVTTTLPPATAVPVTQRLAVTTTSMTPLSATTATRPVSPTTVSPTTRVTGATTPAPSSTTTTTQRQWTTRPDSSPSAYGCHVTYRDSNTYNIWTELFSGAQYPNCQGIHVGPTFEKGIDIIEVRWQPVATTTTTAAFAGTCTLHVYANDAPTPAGPVTDLVDTSFTQEGQCSDWATSYHNAHPGHAVLWSWKHGTYGSGGRAMPIGTTAP